MSSIGISYSIKEGDTLWDIAARELGDPGAWPEIIAFNNMPHISATGARRINDPDHIYAGSTLRLPIFEDAPRPRAGPSAAVSPRPGSLKDQIPNIQMPVNVAYDIPGNWIVLDRGSFIARIRQKGRILMTLGQKVPFTSVMNGGVEATTKSHTDTVFGHLLSENNVSFDPATKAIKFSNKMISASGNLDSPKTAIGVEVSSNSGAPVLKAEIIYDQLNGQVFADWFVALDYQIEIEIEPRPPRPPVPQPVPVTVTERAPSFGRSVPRTDWWDVAKKASIGTLVVAGVVTVIYGASVVFSGGTSSVGAPAYATAMSVILVSGTTATIAVQ
jgi:hypothetical protein